MNRQTFRNRKTRVLASGLVALGIVCLALVVGLPQAAAQPPTAPQGTLFLPYQRKVIQDFTDAVAIGDFNNDGRNDAAMTTLNSLEIYLQQVDGTLADPVSYPGAGSYTMVAGDFNHDGRTDLALAKYTLQVMLQKSDGTMDTAVPYDVLGSPIALAVGDVNKDGWADLLLAYGGSGLVSVYVQQTDGTLLASASCYTTQSGSNDLEVGDMNDDDKLDLVPMGSSGFDNPNLSVCLQNASDGFENGVPYKHGTVNANGLGVGDVNGDGLDDAVVATGGNGDGTLTVFAQTNTGTLAEGASYHVRDIPSPVKIADVNGDTRADVLVMHAGWANVSVLLQKSDGTLDAPDLYAIPYGNRYPQSFDIGDLNSDGYPDLLLGDGGLTVLYHYDPAHPPTATPTVTVQPSKTPKATSTPPLPTAVPQTFFTEGFEGNFPGAWTVDQGHWGKSSCAKLNGSNGAWVEGASGLPCGSNYHTAEYSWLTYGPFDLSNTSQADLDYALLLNAEPEYDWLFVGASTDGDHFYGNAYSGASQAQLVTQPQDLELSKVAESNVRRAPQGEWKPVNAPEATDANWRGMNFDLNHVPTLGNLSGTSTVWITFLWFSDVDVTYPNGAFIDQVRLSRSGLEKAPAKPKLLAPAQGSTLTTQRPDLTWKAAARAVEYRVHIRQDSPTGTEVQAKSKLKVTHFKTKNLAKGKTYYWTAEGCNSAACTPSKVGSFTIAP